MYQKKLKKKKKIDLLSFTAKLIFESVGFLSLLFIATSERRDEKRLGCKQVERVIVTT